MIQMSKLFSPFSIKAILNTAIKMVFMCQSVFYPPHSSFPLHVKMSKCLQIACHSPWKPSVASSPTPPCPCLYILMVNCLYCFLYNLF